MLGLSSQWLMSTQKILNLANFLESTPDINGFYRNKILFEISQNSKENTCFRVSFSNKIATLFKKGFGTDVFMWILFSCQICEIFKNSFFYRPPPVAVTTPSICTRGQFQTKWCAVRTLLKKEFLATGFTILLNARARLLLKYNKISSMKKSSN